MRFGCAVLLPGLFQALDERASLMQATKVEAMLNQHNHHGGGHGVKNRGKNAKKLVQMTKKMEKEYEDTALNVVNGASEIPEVTLTSIKDLMETIAEQVQSEHNEDDAQAGILRDAIEKCNGNCEADTTNTTHGVAFYKNKADDAEDDHSECRDQEVDDQTSMDTKCDAYDDGADDARDKKDNCDCQWNENTTADAVLECVAKQSNWAKNHKAQLDALKENCTNATDTYTDTAEDCDEKQAIYESHYCAYASKQTTVCNNLATCRQDAIDEFNRICDEIEIVAETRKAVWISIEKIKCYVDVMLTAEHQNITQTEVNVCIAMVVDTTHLDFHRPAIPPAYNCSDVESYPGEDAWAQLYDSKWTGLEDVTACVMPA